MGEELDDKISQRSEISSWLNISCQLKLREISSLFPHKFHRREKIFVKEKKSIVSREKSQKLKTSNLFFSWVSNYKTQVLAFNSNDDD